MSPQGAFQVHDNLSINSGWGTGGLGDNDDGDEDVEKTLRTGGGEGRGPMEILFLITVLLGGWLGVVARLIIARWWVQQH